MRLKQYFSKTFKLIKMEISAWVKLIIRAMPDSPIGYKLRQFYWRKKANLLGTGHILRMADIVATELTTIGENFICSESVIINASDSLGIYIGNNVLLGPRVYMRAANHKFDNLNQPINTQGHKFATIDYKEKKYSIVIEDDVWIGANAIILSGVKIGKGAIVGAGSVVTKNVPSASIVAGSPARVMKMRDNNLEPPH